MSLLFTLVGNERSTQSALSTQITIDAAPQRGVAGTFDRE
jgi:hypothetical protein